MAVTCNIKEEVGKVGKLEINLVEWNGGKPKIDVRSWYADDNGDIKPGRGINFTAEQADAIIDAIKAAKELLESMNV